MMHRKSWIAGSALALLTIPAVAAAPASKAPVWTVDKGASTLGFESAGNGSAFAGSFAGWNADVRFDPANLAASSANVTIDTGTASTGDSSRDDPLPGAQWFATSAFPTATFTTTSITSDGANSYVADGTLTVKGVSLPIRLPFTLTIEGERAEMAGSVVLDRTMWNIGKGSWQDKSVDPKVTVKVRISATKAG